MFQDSDPSSFDKHSEKPLDLNDLSDLRNPERSSPEMAQRVLHEAYLGWARIGTKGENELVRGRDNFTFDDMQVFSSMEAQLRLEVANSLHAGGLDHRDPNIHIRFLHPLVAVSPERRERHYYVEILKDCRDSVLAFRQTAQVFQCGPVGLHAYSPDESKPDQLVKCELVSRPAFCEGLRAMYDDLEARRTGRFCSSWVWRWALEEAFKEVKDILSTQVDSAPTQPGAGSLQPIVCQKLRYFRTAEDTAQIHAKIGDIDCSVLLGHDSRRQQPNIFTSISSPDCR
jgi:hypothetical protein